LTFISNVTCFAVFRTNVRSPAKLLSSEGSLGKRRRKREIERERERERRERERKREGEREREREGKEREREKRERERPPPATKVVLGFAPRAGFRDFKPG
jgi:hypothetical protein